MNPWMDRLGMTVPVVQAPMANVSTAAMAAAVTRAGGLGSISIGASDARAGRIAIRGVREALGNDSAFNVNVFCHRPPTFDARRDRAWLEHLRPSFANFSAEPPDALHEIYRTFVGNEEMLQLLLEEKPAVVSFHFGLPGPEAIGALKRAGMLLFASATSILEGRMAEEAGIDVVVAQGYEAGGHRGIFDPEAGDECLGTLALTRLLVRSLHVPVIAAGGIMDGAGIAACLTLGASAVQMGTAFINCPESSADAGFRAALARTKEGTRTVMTESISGRPARCIANKFTAIKGQPPDYPLAYDAAKALHAAAKKHGDHGYGAHWAGQGAALARSMPAGELIATLAGELRQARP